MLASSPVEGSPGLLHGLVASQEIDTLALATAKIGEMRTSSQTAFFADLPLLSIAPLAAPQMDILIRHIFMTVIMPGMHIAMQLEVGMQAINEDVLISLETEKSVVNREGSLRQTDS